MRIVIISGSSRGDGDTANLINELRSALPCEVVDLNDFRITYYDYKHLNKGDDFIPLMKKLLNKYDTFIFATPVYWYAMSGIMKVFFDRLTDLITIEKDLGRKLRGKNMAAISTSNGNNLGEFFWLPFIKTAEYLGMNYLGSVHTYSGEENSDKLLKLMG